jgi:putative hydrolase of the HAD superfamily
MSKESEMTNEGRGAVLFCDADNTLWDTDSVFSKAQLALLERIEETTAITYDGTDRLAFVRSIDQTLAERHHADLRYPPRLLACATALVLKGMDVGSAARVAEIGPRKENVISQAAAHSVEKEFIQMVRRVPKLREGVWSGLEELRQMGTTIFVITEGARERAIRTASALGISRFLDRLIEAPKRTELYRRVLQLRRASGGAFMVGDQLDRDIGPAKRAGLETIYFPGGFIPRWSPDVEAIGPAQVISSFDEVPEIVCRSLTQEPVVTS